MSKRLLLSVIILSVIIGLLIGYVRGIPADFGDAPPSDQSLNHLGD